MKQLGFSTKQRLRSRRDFQDVFARGEVASDNVLVIHALRSGHPTRLGISISRRVGCAVIRNRWKRLIREAFRLMPHRLPGQLALVVRPRRGARPDLAAIKNSIVRLSQRLDRKQLQRLGE